MSKTGRTNYRRTAKGHNRATKPEYRIVVESDDKDPYDIQWLSKAAIGMSRANSQAAAVDTDQAAGSDNVPAVAGEEVIHDAD